MTTKLLIINADDFGISPGVTRGIIEAATAGVVTSTSVMVTSQHIDSALDALAASSARLGLGLHVVLNGNTLPLTDGATFTAAGRYLPSKSWQLDDAVLFKDEITAEIRAQYDKFVRLIGRPPDHLDSHHNILFENPLIKAATIDFIRATGMPIRDPAKGDWLNSGSADEQDNPLIQELRAAQIRFVRTIRDFRGKGANIETLLSIFGSIGQDGVYELMCHPGHVDENLHSSYNVLREHELAALLQPTVPEVIQRHGIRLVTYSAAFA